ncbi:glycosyltransferase [Brachybacterium alimentarium]|uniref:glycosyltransferase n=1 Tax=Brachybacterium alimentarium TaxID=47845 RepID=UPI000DF40249|nr:glycosyltransferase [Brachybacterium alimentarium]RCS63897.1 glycosyltransferase [Brachybacterium alimentarium]
MLSVIPESFGGMVTVALQRSSMFADRGNRKVEILTKSPNMDDPIGRADELHAAGRLSASVPIRNVWAEVKVMSDRDLIALGSVDAVLSDLPDDALVPDGSNAVYRKDAKGQVLQVDYFRPDGTRSISDRSDAAHSGRRGGRRITTYTRAGEVAGQWTSLRKFYQSWVDWVIGSREAILIIDSAPAGGLFYDYRRPNVLTVQAIHNHHILQMSPDQSGKLTADVMKMFTHLDWFDAVAVLTPAQETDLMEAGALGKNSFVAPNMLISPPGKGEELRDPTKGVVIARQVKQKRLDHALKALSRVGNAADGIHIDFFGNGREANKLAKLAEGLGIDGMVEWKGYDPAAKEQFKTASFTVLSSRYEGHPVVLLEAMSAGCIPIAYDVDYGPRDTITHGVDGFLISEGDVEALAEAITRVTSMQPRELVRMRRAAVRKSRDFLPASIMRKWGKALSEARAAKSGSINASGKVKLATISQTEQGVSLEVDISGEVSSLCREAQIAWVGRNGDAFGRSSAQVARHGKRLVVSGCVPDESLSVLNPETVLDVYVDLATDVAPFRSRIVSKDVSMPAPHARFAPYVTVAGNLSLKCRSGS